MLSIFRYGSPSDRVLSKGAAVAFATQVSAVGLGYMAHVLLARWMGVTEYGVYVYTLGWAVPLAAFGGLGMHMMALRFVPSYVSAEKHGLVRGLYRMGSRLSFLVGAALALLAIVLLTILEDRISSVVWLSLIVGLSLVPLLSLTHFNASFLRALKRVGWAGLSDVLRPPILVAGAGVLVMTTGTVVARDILMILGGALLFIAGLQHLLVRKARPAASRNAEVETDFPVWKKTVAAMLLIEVFQAVMIKADILLLGAMIDVEAVAVFGVAARVAGLVGFVVAAVNTMAAPMFTELQSEGRHDDLRALVRTASRWMLWPSLFVAAVLAAFSTPVLSLFGPEFVAGKSVMWILLVAQLVNAGAGPVFVLVTFTGFQDQSARIYGYMLCLNIILNVVGIRLFGIHGAASATLITALVWGVLLHRVVSANLNLTASPVARLLGYETVPSRPLEE